jgi:hypothetical protein
VKAEHDMVTTEPKETEWILTSSVAVSQILVEAQLQLSNLGLKGFDLSL